MPRPGPRPYECVRRAWHSDRHQPIRGSVIQEIFRVMNEVHCSATRKNREWQEKLPIVVLKAEEIMYSKANSEAEYSDFKTLWERVNDAINTIIRRDESTETGEAFLQPCIEAALHLGCTPRRASRSQRNDSPRHYLRPETSGNTSVLIPNDGLSPKPYGNRETVRPLMIDHNPQLSTLPLSSCFRGDQNHIHNIKSNSVKKNPIVGPTNSPASWSVYPLYYYNNSNNSCPIQTEELKLCHSRAFNSSSHLDAPDFILGSNNESNLSAVRGMECDLTLRLGSPVASCDGIRRNWSSQDRSKQSRHEETWQMTRHFLPHSG
ncbi:DNA-directed RNA polymerase subunit beta'' [Striga asiatica]|uniref:DNA-directed RNA polymerase subunit beta n=1 Tax=Striga asiatica TaxID=4170 RepID=A0A5A7R2W6_STRAF|nr:DNA-directed RNA polymerase subunit beta'' [Striga asiatica]